MLPGWVEEAALEHLARIARKAGAVNARRARVKASDVLAGALRGRGEKRFWVEYTVPGSWVAELARRLDGALLEVESCSWLVRASRETRLRGRRQRTRYLLLLERLA